MAQTTTVLPTGIRVFNSVTIPAGQETDILFIQAGDGGQLTLEQVDGRSSGSVRIRAYSVQKGVRRQVAEFNVSAGSFVRTFLGGVITEVDELVPNPLPFSKAQEFGLVGSGGIVLTGESAGGAVVEIGATADRRIDGPFDLKS